MCTIGWNRADDTFELGQWLKGRIYERRCDLSPDGRHLIYFAMNGRWMDETRGSWTAISKAPYLKALALWPKGDCWNGGGLFLSNRKYWLNGGHDGALWTPPDLVEIDEYPGVEGGYGECPAIYYPRLQRDDWSMRYRSRSKAIFEKALPRGWTLRKIAHSQMPTAGRGAYFDEHELAHEEGAHGPDTTGWSWADLDRDRLVWIVDGVLHAGELTRSGVGRVRCLRDFNDMTFERRTAPY